MSTIQYKIQKISRNREPSNLTITWKKKVKILLHKKRKEGCTNELKERTRAETRWNSRAFLATGKNHEGRYTFQIFFERRISKGNAHFESEWFREQRELARVSRFHFHANVMPTAVPRPREIPRWKISPETSLPLPQSQSYPARCKFPYRTAGGLHIAACFTPRNNSRRAYVTTAAKRVNANRTYFSIYYETTGLG